MNELILASQSIGRKKLFEHYFTRFSIHVSDVDESVIPPLDPAHLTEQLAILKGEAVANRYPDDYVLGFDTVVACDGNILGKPNNIEHAKEMLRYLSGKNQSVYSGYSIFHQSKGIGLSGYGETVLHFKYLSDAFINEYVHHNPVTRFAGGYGIQENDEFITITSGDFDTVVGAPIEIVIRELRRIGVPKSLFK